MAIFGRIVEATSRAIDSPAAMNVHTGSELPRVSRPRRKDRPPPTRRCDAVNAWRISGRVASVAGSSHWRGRARLKAFPGRQRLQQAARVVCKAVIGVASSSVVADAESQQSVRLEPKLELAIIVLAARYRKDHRIGRSVRKGAGDARRDRGEHRIVRAAVVAAQYAVQWRGEMRVHPAGVMRCWQQGCQALGRIANQRSLSPALCSLGLPPYAASGDPRCPHLFVRVPDFRAHSQHGA